MVDVLDRRNYLNLSAKFVHINLNAVHQPTERRFRLTSCRSDQQLQAEMSRSEQSTATLSNSYGYYRERLRNQAEEVKEGSESIEKLLTFRVDDRRSSRVQLPPETICIRRLANLKRHVPVSDNLHFGRFNNTGIHPERRTRAEPGCPRDRLHDQECRKHDLANDTEPQTHSTINRKQKIQADYVRGQRRTAQKG